MGRVYRSVPAVMIAVTLAAGCVVPPLDWPQTRTTQAGSLGLDTKSGNLWVADSFNGGVALVDPAAQSGNIAFIPTGNRPEHIVMRMGTAFVSNRFSRTVTQIDIVSRKVVRNIATGAEPMGMDVSNDDSTLYVACGMSGSVQAFDTGSGAQKWETSIGEEVRAVAYLASGSLYVPGYKSGQMHVLDASSGIVSTSFRFTPLGQLRLPTSVEHVLAGVGSLLYVTSSMSLTSSLGTVIAGYYVSPSPAAFTVPPAVTPIDPAKKSVPSPFNMLARFPAPTRYTPGQLAGPKVSIADSTQNFIITANYLSNNIAITGITGKVAPELFATEEGPDGLALSRDGTMLYVHNKFAHSITVIDISAGAGNPALSSTIKSITPQPLDPGVWNGMKVFHNAASAAMSSPSSLGLACASCHPDGREDGNTWHFGEGPRNTPSLVGRDIQNTAPYHWDGSMADLPAIQQIVQVRMGGAGLSTGDWEDMMAYLSHEPAPDNPNVSADGTLNEQQEEGFELFTGAAGCAACHVGTAFTDNGFHNVGTAFTTISQAALAEGSSTAGAANPNTPSLRGVFATAPYLHTGAMPTIEARIMDNPAGTHGNTANLTGEQVSALAAYLRTL